MAPSKDFQDPPPEARFFDSVVRVITSIPTGEVSTYGEVAREAGYPGRARAVGHILATNGNELPWWRVVAANGRLVPGHEADHTRRLKAEGVSVRDGKVRWPKASGRGRAPRNGPAR